MSSERPRCPRCEAWLHVVPIATGTIAERCSVCPYVNVIKPYRPTGPVCEGCGVEMIRRRRGPAAEKCDQCGGRGRAKRGARRRLAQSTTNHQRTA